MNSGRILDDANHHGHCTGHFIFMRADNLFMVPIIDIVKTDAA